MRERVGRVVMAAACLSGLLVGTEGSAGADPIAASVVIDELSYHPTVDLEEFLELANPGDGAFDLSGACFTAGITGCFPSGTSVPAHGFVVAATDPASLALAFPAAPTAVLQYGGALSNGGERITLTASGGVDVLDTVAYDDEGAWPVAPDGAGPSLELTDLAADNDAPGPWAASNGAPTPGTQNSTYGQGPAPEITAVQHGAVAAASPVSVTAALAGATSVQLEVTVGFDDPTTTPMADDGVHDDGEAGDGTYGASIPGQSAGTLVRYRVLASAASGSASFPANGDPRRLLGYLVARPAVDTPLPVLDWYLDPDDYQYLLDHALTNDYVPAVVAYGDEVWDGAVVRVQGAGRPPPKYSFKFKMPKGHPLVAPGLIEDPVEEFVVDSDPRDSTGIVAALTMSVYRDSFPDVPQIGKVHVERNGEPHGLFTFIEEYETRWRTRNDLGRPGDEQFEPEGAIGTFQDDGSADALVPRFERIFGEDHTNLYDLVQVIDSPSLADRPAQLRAAFDVPALVEFLAVGAVVQHWDSTVHNFLVLRDAETHRWRFLPQDLDFTLGQPLSGVTTPTWLKVRATFPYGPDNLVSALRHDPVLTEMFFRRVRTLADRYLAGGEIADRAATMAPDLADEVAFDRTKWGLEYTQPIGLSALDEFLEDRATELLDLHRRPGEVPDAADASLPVTIAHGEHQAAGGSSDDEVVLVNPSPTESIDLSGWTLEGAGTAQLPLGTVLVGGGSLLIPGEPETAAPAFDPTMVVAGHLDDGLSDAGGELRVVDTDGTTRGSVLVEDLAPRPDGGLPRPDLELEASAEQVETTSVDAAGIALDVVVRNRTAAPIGPVTVVALDTTCARTIASVPALGSVRFRCRTEGSSGPDHTYVLAASAGPRQDDAVIGIRTLGPQTSTRWLQVPGPVVLRELSMSADGSYQGPVTPPTVGETAPLRWLVLTGSTADRAAPTRGLNLALGGAMATVIGSTPERIAVAARNAAGTGARSATTPYLTGRLSGTWPFATTAAYVDGMYRLLDGRPPSAGELAIWTKAIDDGAPAGLLVANRLSGPHWSSTVEPLVRLYQAYFGRPPDRSGLAYWVRRRQAGDRLARTAAAFAATSEFRRTYGELGNAAFTSLVYRNVLGREADAAGLVYWVRRLDTGTSRGTLMTAFSESSEGRRKLGPAVIPSVVRFALLGAAPAATAIVPDVEWVAAGGSALTVIDGVRSSDAFAEALAD